MATRKTAAAAEALAETIPFTFEGNDYELLPSSEWDLEVLEAAEDGRVIALLRGLLVGDGYDRLKATKPKAKQLEAFVAEAMEALGVQGN